MAAIQNDFSTAADYYLQALAHADSDPYLQDSALVALISTGEMERATALAVTMSDQGRATDLAKLVQRTEMARTGRWDALVSAIGDVPASRGGDTSDGTVLVDGLMHAWAQLGSGRAGESLTEFKQLTKLRGAASMVNYHLALAKAQVGDFEGAELLLADPATGAHILGIIAHAQVLSQLERNRDAIAMLEETPALPKSPISWRCATGWPRARRCPLNQCAPRLTGSRRSF
ncbi:hypothetical protein ACFSS8_13530 [Paracoccus kondratievae]